MLVGGTCTDLESQLKSLLFAEVSNPVGNLLMLFSFVAFHRHDFQIFATSHAPIPVLNPPPQVSLSTLWHLRLMNLLISSKEVCLTNHICSSVNFVQDPSALSPLN